MSMSHSRLLVTFKTIWRKIEHDLKVFANVGMDSDEFWLRVRGSSLYRVYPNMESVRLGEKKKED